MDEPIDFGGIDALLARSREARRELAEAVRQAREVQAWSLALRDWCLAVWPEISPSPSPKDARPVH
jgi:hypothetical protein